MLCLFQRLRGYSLHTTDDVLGKVHDVYFDDQTWTVRWLVADTRRWFGRRVLLPTQSLATVDDERQEFVVGLTRDQIRASPSVELDRPVSRQAEGGLYDHYGVSPYWLAPMTPAGVALYGWLGPAAAETGWRIRHDRDERNRDDPHLRSAMEVCSYSIEASDGPIGSVSDLLLDEAGWIVRYLLIDTGRWLPGRQVIVAPDWVEAVSWDGQEVRLDMKRQQVRASPEYRADANLDRVYEAALYRHYDQPPYWKR